MGLVTSGTSEVYLILPRYQSTAPGVYQLPWQIDVGANLAARPGFSARRSRLYSP